MNKQQLKELSNRYAEVFNYVLSNYPAWRRNAILDDLKVNNTSSIVDDFIKIVISQVEATELATKLELTQKNINNNKNAVIKKNIVNDIKKI